jgi:hypothetical protein
MKRYYEQVLTTPEIPDESKIPLPDWVKVISAQNKQTSDPDLH